MGIRVLIVDDERAIRTGVRRILESAALEVVGEAQDGSEAVDLVQQLRPDVVVMDISMPLMNGFEATRKIKQESPKVKVVILTIHSGGTYLKAASDTGADAYLIKKMIVPQLLSTIRQLGEEFQRT